jgi:hypothetical protein
MSGNGGSCFRTISIVYGDHPDSDHHRNVSGDILLVRWGVPYRSCRTVTKTRARTKRRLFR